MVLGGYFLEAWVRQRFGFSLTEYIDIIAVIIILVTTLPIMYKLFFAKKHVVPRSDDDPNAVL
jgi:membrane-associated protein